MTMPHQPVPATNETNTDGAFQAEFGNQFRDLRFLVTGATGFVGLNLCPILQSLGAQVEGAALPAAMGSTPTQGRVLPVDLTDQDAARRLVESVQPDIVVHLAGLVDTRQSPDRILPTLTHNLMGSIHLLAALAGTGCRRVVLVTSSEMPPPGSVPTSPYAASKLAMVSYAGMFHALYGLPAVIARPHLLYGPHQPPDKLIPYLIRCGLERSAPRLSSGTRVCDPTFVLDLVRALLYMVSSDAGLGMTLDVGTGAGTTVAQIAALVLRKMGSDQEPVFGALPDRIGETEQVADARQTESVLGWKPAWSLEAGLDRTIGWYRSTRDASRRTDAASPEVSA